MRAVFKRRFAAWVALGAVLFAAWSPFLAALRFQGTPAILAQICTLDGIRSSFEQPSAPSHRDARGIKHCVFCLSGAWQPPPAEAPGIVPSAVVETAVAPERDDAGRLDFSALQPLSPRAPPLA